MLGLFSSGCLACGACYLTYLFLYKNPPREKYVLMMMKDESDSKQNDCNLNQFGRNKIKLVSKKGKDLRI